MDRLLSSPYRILLPYFHRTNTGAFATVEFESSPGIMQMYHLQVTLYLPIVLY